MEFPLELYAELGDRYGVALPAGAPGQTVRGIRLRADGAEEDGFLPVPADAPPAFLNEALALTERFGSWQLRLDAALEAGASPQELVSLSEEALGEPLLVADPSMKRLAATVSIPTQDTFFHEVSTLGYPRPETYASMDREHYYDPRFYTGEMIRLQTHESPPLNVALQAIRIEGRLAATALMLFQREPWAESRARLFSMLVERIAAALRRERPQGDLRGRQYDFLLRDLLDGKALSEEEIAARLRYTDYPQQDALHVVLLRADNSSRARVGYVCRMLESVFRQSRPLIYEDHVLTTLPARETLKSESLDELERFCAETGCRCGVSGRIGRLSELRAAYEQALDTLRLGPRLSAPDTWFSLAGGPHRERCFCHDDFAPYRALRAFGAERELRGLCRPELLRLQELDEKNATDNLRVLYLFLCCHQNYTDTARRLYMHRNSVIYRIERICTLMGVESVDADLERALMFSYCLLDMLRLADAD